MIYRKIYLLVFLLVLSQYSVKANTGTISYCSDDSIEIVNLLNQGLQQPKNENLILFYARYFINRPYGGGILDKNKDEHLTIYLKKLDCLTFVETTMALYLTTKQKRKDFKSFCQNLQNIRYKNGEICNYTSRLHYFSTWIANGERNKYIKEVIPEKCGSSIFAKRKKHINFMSQHRLQYPALINHPEYIKSVVNDENILSDKIVYYIPRDKVGYTIDKLGEIIKDGDILAMVTGRKGLDVSHLGFAVWGKDKKLHLLNASSLHKKVVLERRPLDAYMKTQRLQEGIRVIRIK